MAKSDTGRKRVTLTDVARAAGVSKSTVSLVLNDSSLIKKETQQKVQQAIEQLGYVYNRFAANLRSQKSLTIGVVIDDLINPFFAEFTMGLEMTLAEHGFITVMSNTSQRSDRQKQVLDTLLEHHVAGIVLCPVNSTSEADLQRYANSFHTLINHDAPSGLATIARRLRWRGQPRRCTGSDGISHSTRAQRYRVYWWSYAPYALSGIP
ncbi:LacI family DNA-binding transcriptional regulator [Escherichia coli]